MDPKIEQEILVTLNVLYDMKTKKSLTKLLQSLAYKIPYDVDDLNIQFYCMNYNNVVNVDNMRKEMENEGKKITTFFLKHHIVDIVDRSDVFISLNAYKLEAYRCIKGCCTYLNHPTDIFDSNIAIRQIDMMLKEQGAVSYYEQRVMAKHDETPNYILPELTRIRRMGHDILSTRKKENGEISVTVMKEDVPLGWYDQTGKRYEEYEVKWCRDMRSPSYLIPILRKEAQLVANINENIKITTILQNRQNNAIKSEESPKIFFKFKV